MRLVSLVACLLLAPVPAFAETICASPATAARDGAKDFDWEIGLWTTRLKRLKNPLSGKAPIWIDYEGTSDVRPVMGGKANLVDLDVTGPAGRIVGASWRLYNPAAKQWTLNFASAAGSVLTPAQVGGFNGKGCGEFYALDSWGDRAILVRFVITDVTADSARFEQAFSADGGRSWEVNWVAIDTRRAK